jgi:hypothetical protein
MVAARSVILTKIVPSATSAIMVIRILDSPNNIDQAVWLLSILVLVLLLMLIDYFNGSVRACSLGIVSQIKIMEKPLLVFIVCYLSFAAFEKLQDCVIEE